MATGSLDDRLLFKRMKFHYAVFDEGHMLKNMTSARYKGLTRIQASSFTMFCGIICMCVVYNACALVNSSSCYKHYSTHCTIIGVNFLLTAF